MLALLPVRMESGSVGRPRRLAAELLGRQERRRARITASTPVPAIGRGRSSATTSSHRSGSRAASAASTELHLPGRGRRRSGGRVDRTMANQEQGPAASDDCRHPLHHLLDRPGRVDIQGDHKVVLVPLRRPGRKIGVDPVDALGDVRPHGLGRRPGVCQGRRGEVNRGDLPSARSHAAGLASSLARAYGGGDTGLRRASDRGRAGGSR
jgi:hypothetical protein